MHGNTAQVGKGEWECTGCRRGATQVREGPGFGCSIGWEGHVGLTAACARKGIWECIRCAAQLKEGM